MSIAPVVPTARAVQRFVAAGDVSNSIECAFLVTFSARRSRAAALLLGSENCSHAFEGVQGERKVSYSQICRSRVRPRPPRNSGSHWGCLDVSSRQPSAGSDDRRRVSPGSRYTAAPIRRKSAISDRSRSSSRLAVRGRIRPRSMAGLRQPNRGAHCLNPAIYGHSTALSDGHSSGGYASENGPHTPIISGSGL
jgi:hypothetical protein